MLIGFDQHVHRKPKAHLFGVHQGYPPFENALGLQALNAAPAGGTGQGYGLCEFRQGLLRVPL